MANRRVDNGNSKRFYFFEGGGAPKSMQMLTAAIKLKGDCFLAGKAMTNLDSMLKSGDVTLLTKIH